MKHLFTITGLCIFLYAPCIVFADKELDEDQMKLYRPGLQETLETLKNEPENIELQRKAGILRFHIGRITRQAKTVQAAMEIFEKILEKTPKDAETRAYYGAAYVIKARDYPESFLASIKRLKYVRKGIAEMDKAVESDAAHPVARIVRGIFCLDVPKFLDQFDKATSDIYTLANTLQTFKPGDAWSDILKNRSFQCMVYYYAGEVERKTGLPDKAKAFYEKAMAVFSDSPYAAIARRKMRCRNNPEE